MSKEHILPQAHKYLQDLPPYKGGRAALAGVEEVYKLSANENPLGASPLARAAQEAFHDLHIYPDGASTYLRAEIAARNGLNEARIICGNGSGEILYLLAQAYLGAGDEVLYSAHGFLLYKLVSQACNATPIGVPETNLTTDCTAILAAITQRTKMIFLANPNNPTGTMLSLNDIEALHARIPSHILCIFDEAYIEYVAPERRQDLLKLAEHADNIVITRTFSKAYGLAALRVGWAYCPHAVADILNRIRPPFNVSAIAQAAACAALDDTAHLAASYEHNRLWRDRLTQAIKGMGLEVTPSETNFLLIHFASPAMAQKADEFWTAKGIIARNVASYGLPHCLRLSIGDETANRRALDTLAIFMKDYS